MSSRGSSRGSSRHQVSTGSSFTTDIAVPPSQTPTLGRGAGEGLSGVLLIRPGEDCTAAFPSWTRDAIDKYGEYEPYDLNQPLTLPKRPGGLPAFAADPPLTHLGSLQAKLAARGLKHSAIPIGLRLYADPSLPAVQTATVILRHLHLPSAKLRVEPGLAPWQAATPIAPAFLAIPDLHRNAFPLDVHYRPFLALPALRRSINETLRLAYLRQARTLNVLTQAHRDDTKLLLIVGDASLLDAARRFRLATPAQQLTPSQPHAVNRAFPPAASLHLHRPLHSPHWLPAPSPLPPLTTTHFSSALSPTTSPPPTTPAPSPIPV